MKVSELTVEELKELIKTQTYIAVDEALLDFFGDPDEGLEFSEDVAQQLKESVEAVRQGKIRLIPLEEVKEERTG
jgi:hypothetical protein